MARIRSIKPEFWTAGQVLECSTNARLLFIGLWNFCDDKGRHPWRPKQIKAQVFPSDPFTENDIHGMLLELSKNNLITYYEVESQGYFYVNGWHHQRIDKPQEPKHPAPIQEDSENIPRTIPPDRIGKEGIGSDPIGIDRKGNGMEIDHVSQATRFDEFWFVYPVHRERKKAEEIWRRRKLDTMADLIITDVTKRIHDDDQWKQGFIPHPTTYLRNDRWEDELTNHHRKKDGSQEFLESFKIIEGETL